MLTRFLCLANSFKEGGRCLAGIELDNQNNPVFIDGRPKWIRPVCNTAHGEVPTHLVSHLHVLDIIELEVTGHPDKNYQSENATFLEKSIQKAGTFSKDKLMELCEHQSTIFGNRGK